MLSDNEFEFDVTCVFSGFPELVGTLFDLFACHTVIVIKIDPPQCQLTSEKLLIGLKPELDLLNKS
jgi:hypothetical protein